MKGTEPLYDFLQADPDQCGMDQGRHRHQGQYPERGGRNRSGKGGNHDQQAAGSDHQNAVEHQRHGGRRGGASVSMASPKGGNYNTALREAQQMANNGYDMAQITEYLIRKNYSDSTISQVSQTMGW